MTTLDPRALAKELRQRAEYRATEGPFTKENLVEWRAAEYLNALSQPQAGEPVAWLTPFFENNRDGKLVPIIVSVESTATPDDGWEPLYASPHPTNPAQVTDAMVEAAVRAYNKNQPFEASVCDSSRMRAALTAAIGAGGAWPSLLDRERAAMDVTQRRAIEAERIASAVTAQVTERAILALKLRQIPTTNIGDAAVIGEAADALAAIGAGGQAVADGAEEQEIDRLRLQAFKTNSNDDKAAYYLAVSKWFQDRHYRALSQPHPADERVVEALREACNFIDDERDRNPDSAHPNDRDEIEERNDLRPKLIAKINSVLSAKEGRS